MKVIVSLAMSVDGCLDDARAERLVLSAPADFSAVRRLRGQCDAILVGANTIRADNPRLAAEDGRSPQRVTLTRSGRLDPGATVFADPDRPTWVYCPTGGAAGLATRLGAGAEVRGLAALDTAPAGDAGDAPGLAAVLDDLDRRGIAALMVEGGRRVLTALMRAGLADELRLAIAPVLIGDPRAPRAFGAGPFHHGPDRRMTLAGVEAVADMAVIHYRLSRA